jgi:hypothetical protein
MTPMRVQRGSIPQAAAAFGGTTLCAQLFTSEAKLEKSYINFLIVIKYPFVLDFSYQIFPFRPSNPIYS